MLSRDRRPWYTSYIEDRPDTATGRSPGRRRGESARLLGMLVLGALGATFAVLNLDEVGVNWIVGTWRTPLIIVIAVALLVGAALGFMVGRRRAAP
jgi:uncharacterized integral membrane protein